MSISQEIESKINIVDLVSRYVPLKKAGANYKWLSPFVQEKTPSFMVSPAKNIAYCFSTHRGGGPIKFLMEIEWLEYRDALKILAKEAWVELKSELGRSKDEIDTYQLYKIAAEWYHQEILKEENADKLAYLTGRGLSLETIKKFQLGYSGNPKDLFYALKKTGATDQQIIESGIFVAPNRDKFFGRIIFPIANFLGHTVAFTGRILGVWEPKYLNSPASKIFDKSQILYGLHLAKGDITKLKYAIVVEGQMDTVALHQAGVTNTVGISGSALTKEHIRQLKRITSRIYLCLDTDKAGVEATFKSIENLINESVDIRIIRVQWAKDPDEYIKNGGKFEDLITGAISHIAFYLAEGSRRHDLSSPVGKKSLVEEIFDVLDRVESQIEVDGYLREVSKSLEINYQTLFEEYTKRKRRRTQEVVTAEKKEFSFAEMLSWYITQYNAFDLFSQNFHYTIADLDWDPSFLLLKKILWNPSRYETDETLDIEKLRGVQVLIEDTENLSTKEKVRETILSYIKTLERSLFQKEKMQLSAQYDISSSQYMEAYMRLIAKAKSFWIPPN